ncbi:MAG TPA: prepilin-type N-terminal cleavage/methylation domain-containing protein [Candidatus Omnitrophota bacterium]|nr:prepilin-type N-terminal cleavage/methylation domain-containing protein [Candidatus Omnitrophota bacterium]
MKKRGFTLIELLVALALTSILLLTGTFFLLNYLKTYDRVSREAGLAQVRLSVMQRMARDIRSADRIISAAPGKLTLAVKSDTIAYDLRDGKVRRTVNTSSSYLTESGQVGRLSFFSPSGGLVSISLDRDSTEAFCRNGK